jgi:CRISPR/Cas system CMR-associated protein Cmr5 small subunit
VAHILLGLQQQQQSVVKTPLTSVNKNCKLKDKQGTSIKQNWIMDNTKPLQEGMANGQHWPAEKLEFKYRIYTEAIISVSKYSDTDTKEDQGA